MKKLKGGPAKTERITIMWKEVKQKLSKEGLGMKR